MDDSAPELGKSAHNSTIGGSHGAHEDYRQRVAAFSDTVSAQRDDLIIQQSGGRVDLYFDSTDLRDAAIGMLAFLSPPDTFDAEAFASPKVLVHCLAARGWLGPIGMLQPHQAEFLSLLNLEFGIPNGLPFRALAQRFLESVRVQLAAAEDGQATISLAEAAYLPSQASAARLLFPAVECVRGSWRTRVAKWRDDRLLTVERKQTDFQKIFDSALFEKLRTTFDVLRPGRPVNNDADAAALTLLAEMVERFNASPDTSPLPRFFSGAPFMMEAVWRAGVTDLFRYISPADGALRSCLCGVDYYLLRSALQPPIERTSKPPEALIEIEALCQTLSTIVQASAPVSAEVLSGILIRNHTMVEVIEGLERYSFLQTVWVSELEHGYVEQVVQELNSAALEMQQPEAKRQLDRLLKELRNELNQGASEYTLAERLWRAIPGRAAKLRESLRTDENGVPNVFQEFGLLRFSFEEGAKASIQRWVSALLEGEEEALAARRFIVSAAFANASDEVTRLVNASTVAAALWVLEFDRELNEILDGHAGADHFSLLIVRAASLQRGRYALPKAISLRLELEERHEQTKNPRIAVGAAYLLFEEWQATPHASSPLRRFEGKDQEHRGSTAHRHVDELVRRAIRYAEQAQRDLPDGDPLKLYAGNQYLFYLVEGAGDDRLSEMDRAAELLMLGQHRSQWQFRYDDTLARYYYRKALSVRTNEGRVDWLRRAHDAIERAWNDSHQRDRSIADFRDFIFASLARYVSPTRTRD